MALDTAARRAVRHELGENFGLAPEVPLADKALDHAYRLALQNMFDTTADPERNDAVKRLLDQQKS